MKILYVEWECFCAEDVKHTFQNLGNEVKNIATLKKDSFEFRLK